jgi:hypothetical protein
MQSRRDNAEGPPTVRPPFDPEAFARDSEQILRVRETETPASGRPTVAPPPHYAPIESETIQVSFSIDSESVPILAFPREDLAVLHLSAIARSLVRHVNGRDSVSLICSRAGMRMAEAVEGLEELAGEAIVTFQRSTL